MLQTNMAKPLKRGKGNGPEIMQRLSESTRILIKVLKLSSDCCRLMSFDVTCTIMSEAAACLRSRVGSAVFISRTRVPGEQDLEIIS